jgi:hypothetical protein
VTAGHSLLISALGGISGYRDVTTALSTGKNHSNSRLGDWVGRTDNMLVLKDIKITSPLTGFEPTT